MHCDMSKFHAAQLFVANTKIAATKRLGHRKRQGSNVGHDRVEPRGQEQGKEGVHERKHVASGFDTVEFEPGTITY